MPHPTSAPFPSEVGIPDPYWGAGWQELGWDGHRLGFAQGGPPGGSYPEGSGTQRAIDPCSLPIPTPSSRSARSGARLAASAHDTRATERAKGLLAKRWGWQKGKALARLRNQN